jgi:hypothetical protein
MNHQQSTQDSYYDIDHLIPQFPDQINYYEDDRSITQAYNSIEIARTKSNPYALMLPD